MPKRSVTMGRNTQWHYLHEAVVAWIDKTTPPSLLPAITVTAVAAPSG
jgi:hypothetical protein